MNEPIYHDCANCWSLNIPEDAMFFEWSEWDSCYKWLCADCWLHADMAFI